LSDGREFEGKFDDRALPYDGSVQFPSGNVFQGKVRGKTVLMDEGLLTLCDATHALIASFYGTFDGETQEPTVGESKYKVSV
jgi:hypothetical protein